MVRDGVFTDDFWAIVEPVLPSSDGRRGRPWACHRTALEGIAWRYRTGSPRRDLPGEFGPWQTAWKRHCRWSHDGTYQKILDAVRSAGLPGVGASDGLDRFLSVDSTVVRAHHHAAGARKTGTIEQDPSTIEGGTGGPGRSTRKCHLSQPTMRWGRSRGGLSTKIHALTDAGTRPVTLIFTAGQAGDNPQLLPLLDLHERQRLPGAAASIPAAGR